MLNKRNIYRTIYIVQYYIKFNYSNNIGIFILIEINYIFLRMLSKLYLFIYLLNE